MSNVFQEIGHGIKVAAVDTEHAIVKVVEFLPKAAAVIATAIKDQPEVKAALTNLVEQASTVIGDVGTDVASKGVNLVEDAKTLADAEAFFSWFKTSFIPIVEQVYSTLKADVDPTPAPAAPAPTAPAAS